MSTIPLFPPLPAGSTLSATFAPSSSSLALFPSKSSSSAPSTTANPSIYFASYASPLLERRELVVEAFTLFGSLQKIVRDWKEERSFRPQALTDELDPALVQYVGRISRLYRAALVSQLAAIEKDDSLDAAEKTASLSHHANLHAIFALTEILYLPSDGLGEGVVGEEVLDWVNTVDRAPSAEDGRTLASLAAPWESPLFFPYLTTLVLRSHILSTISLLTTLEGHPSEFVPALAGILKELLGSRPRSTEFEREDEFLRRWRAWKAAVAEKTRECEELFAQAEDEDLDEDTRLSFEAFFRVVLEILAGSQKRVLEASEDWREALGAWGVWVNPGERREDLPGTLKLILDHHPIDSTVNEEAVQSALIVGDVVRALQQSHLISFFLSSHLSDLLYHIGVVPSPPASLPTTGLRDYFLMSYAEELRADPELWRIVVEYFCEAGEEGRARAEKVLLAVDLDKVEVVAREGVVPAGEGQEKVERRTVEDVVRVASQQGMGEVVERVCKIYAEVLVGQKKYGEAISFCVRAGDQKRIARIAERMLDEYVENGQNSFIHHVDSIPTSLLRPRQRSEDGMDDGEDEPDIAATNPRLEFLARYRDFFALYSRGERRMAAELLVLLLTSGIAPRRFWAVMFLDVVPLLQAAPEILIPESSTYELLRCLEEITSPIAVAGEDVYGDLVSLGKIVAKQEGEKEGVQRALKQLSLVRGALAVHLGRCCSA
ncbi:nuclear pore complex protein Nup85 [Pseudohyphozyma bogoriensis]|nr:nuclear pore complex protein Nup85 [Pseudohyphozyma bogoriensis]